MLGQSARARRSVAAVAGNHVIVALADVPVFVALVHLRAGSVAVRVGEPMAVGQRLGECGNSGNSTEPHLHVQAMDSADISVARGVPLMFRGYHERGRGSRHPVSRVSGIPAERSVVEESPG